MLDLERSAPASALHPGEPCRPARPQGAGTGAPHAAAGAAGAGAAQWHSSKGRVGFRVVAPGAASGGHCAASAPSASPGPWPARRADTQGGRRAGLPDWTEERGQLEQRSAAGSVRGEAPGEWLKGARGGAEAERGAGRFRGVRERQARTCRE